MNVMSDLSVFFPPSLAWEFYNSLRRKSVASFKDSQVRNSTPLPPSPPCLLCRPTLHCSLACRLQHECCMLLQPSPTPFPCNHFGALLFFGVCVCVCAFPLHDLTWTAWFWFESFCFCNFLFSPTHHSPVLSSMRFGVSLLFQSWFFCSASAWKQVIGLHCLNYCYLMMHVVTGIVYTCN